MGRPRQLRAFKRSRSSDSEGGAMRRLRRMVGRRSAVGLLAVVLLSLSLVVYTEGEANAFSIGGFDPVEIGTVLGAGVAETGGAGTGIGAAAGACVASVVCGAAVVAGAGIGLAAYATRDTWFPWLKGLFGGSTAQGGNGGLVSNCNFGEQPSMAQPATAGMIFNWSLVCGSDNWHVSVDQDTSGQYAGRWVCQSPGGVVTSGVGIGVAVEATWNKDMGSGGVTTMDPCPAGQTLLYFGGWIGWQWGGQTSEGYLQFAVGSPIQESQLSVKTTVNCQLPDGTVKSLSVTVQGDDSGIAVPSCLKAYPTSVPQEVMVNAGWPGAEQPQADWKLGNPRTDYPDCINSDGSWKSSCYVTVYVNGSRCTVGADLCTTWPAAPPDVDVECELGGEYKLPLDACHQLQTAFLPNTGVRTPTTTDSSSGVPVDPAKDAGSQTSPTTGPTVQSLPTTGANPGPDPGCSGTTSSASASASPTASPTAGASGGGQPGGLPTLTTLPGVSSGATASAAPDPSTDPCIQSGGEGQSCWGSGWSWNPVSWVEVPVKCALVWAFVPSSGAFTSQLGGIENTVSGSNFGQWWNLFHNALSPPAQSDCEGPGFTLPGTLGKTLGYGEADGVSGNGVDDGATVHPFAMCSGVLATDVRPITYDLATVVIVMLTVNRSIQIVIAMIGLSGNISRVMHSEAVASHDGKKIVTT